MELSYWGISPNIPAWPTDENGEREQAVLLAHTFDSPADADVTISLLTAYGDPMFQILRQGGRRRKGHQRLLRLRRGTVCPGLHGGGRPESAGHHAHAQRGRRVNRKEHPSCLTCRNTKSGCAAPALNDARARRAGEHRRTMRRRSESRFYGPLEFGTAGLRGTMKVGLHQMNIHVIRWATQGFANVICAEGEEAKAPGRGHLHGLPQPLHGVCPGRRRGHAPPTASMCASSSPCGPRRS